MSEANRDYVEYDVNESPVWYRALPLGLQHVLAMFLGNVAPPLIVAGALGLSGANTQLLVQVALFAAGVATLVQCYGIGVIGARLPIVMGTSFVFVGALISLGQEFGLPALFGGLLVGCLLEIVLGFWFHRLRWLFPPAVTSLVVMLIGLTLIPVGMDYAAGGPGAETYGQLHHLGLAGLVFLVTLGMNLLSEGFMKLASVLAGIVVGYLVALPLGLVEVGLIGEASWVGWPRPLAFGLEFEPVVILTMALLFLVTAMETMGDIEGTTSAVGRAADPEELRGGILADGLMSGLASLFNAFPVTSYSQNVGLINFTGVASRHIAGLAGVFLLLLGFVPKVAAVISAMPDAVLGGGALIMFAMIVSSGVRLWIQEVPMDRYRSVMMAVALGLGLAVEFRPDALSQLPETAQFLAAEGILVGGLAAVIVNLIIPASQDA